MKMLLRISFVLALCLAFATTSFAGKYDALFVEGGAQHCIWYDGYCDGVCYSIYAGGSADGIQTGCAGGALVGTTGGRALHISYACDAQAGCDTQLQVVHTILRSDGTWTHYGLSGGLVVVLNSGTYSVAAPRNVEGLPSSMSK